MNAGSQLFRKSYFKTTHNSYQWSLPDQLNAGVRGIELDIHDEFNYSSFFRRIFGRKDNFKVGHWLPGHEVSYLGGNPFFNNNLESWIKTIVKWSNKHDHGPITIFLEIKDNFIDDDNNPSEKYGLIRLNEQIKNSFGRDKKKLYTYQQFCNSKKQLTINDLHNKIIFVLMSYYIASNITIKREILRFRFFKKILTEEFDQISIPALKSRLKYFEDKNIEKVCFPSYNPDDAKKTKLNLQDLPNSLFITSEISEYQQFQNYQDAGHMIRTDFVDEGGIIPPWVKSINFPATNHYNNQNYLALHKWTE